jgi:predicted esterase
VGACVSKGLAAEVKLERIAIVGFSQAACLASEFVACQPRRYGALVAFTGNLIGPMGVDLRHPGQLDGMPVLLSSGDLDPHVPWEQVPITGEVLTAMGTVVQTARYANRPHTILNEEIVAARDLLSAVALP